MGYNSSMRFTSACLIVLTLALATFSFAADKEKKKFPGPAATELLTGWNGLAWGDTLDSFKKKFPDAKANEAGRWLIGKDEELAGVKVTVQYTFNKRNQFEMVTFVPEESAATTFQQKLTEEGVLRENAKGGGWTSQGVTFALGNIGGGKTVAVAINARFKDPAAPKK